jgi:hypothetical protein
MAVDTAAAFDLDDLPMGVFELTEQGSVESLTAGHGMTPMAAGAISAVPRSWLSSVVPGLMLASP